MTLPPAYGETPVPDDEMQWLLPAVIDIIGEPVTKAAIYDLEQALQRDVAEQLSVEVVTGTLALDELLSDGFLRDLHGRLYGELWTWAGRYRRYELNIGVDPAQIAMELRAALGNIQWRWSQTDDWTARELGIAAHAETVRIHPFTDGNGRTTRLLADLIFIAAQDNEELEQYDWNLDKRRYIDLLRAYDRERDPRPLAAFVAVQPFGD